MVCGCHITGRCWAREEQSISERHRASILSYSPHMLASTLSSMSLSVDW